MDFMPIYFYNFRAPPTHEEMIINLTAEKDALEDKLLQERKDWRAEQKRLKNKISVLEKLSTDYKGSDEGLGKVVRELQAHGKIYRRFTKWF